MFWSAPVSAWSWQREGCKWDIARLSWGSRCSPCSAGLHQFGESGSTSGWAALERRGPSGASQCRHHCLSLDTQRQHHYYNLIQCFFQVRDTNNYLYKRYIANVSMYWHIKHKDLAAIAISLNSYREGFWLLNKTVKQLKETGFAFYSVSV